MKRYELETLTRRTGESGVVLILVACLIVTIFVFAALAIDFSQMSATAQQGTNSAKFTALAALQGYMSVPEGSDRPTRLAAALTAAQNAAARNLALTIGGKAEADEPQDTGSAGPMLIAGKYYVDAPTGNSLCTNPCTSGASPPCFVPLTDVNIACEPIGTTEPQANSFRIVGTYFSNIRSVFSRVISSGQSSVSVDEIATLAPRWGIFLVDISDSMFPETHSPQNAHPSFYSYYLTADNGTTPYPGYDTNWAALDASRNSPSSSPPAIDDPEYPKTHYKSDYTEAPLLTDADYSSEYQLHHPDPSVVTVNGADYSAQALSGRYRVDTYRDAHYAGPEPFTTVMSGLNTAVEQYKARAVIGDKLGIIFFDKVLTWPRIINLTPDFDYIKKFTDPTVTNDPDRGLQRLIRHGIFPSNDNKTNLMMAATEAMRQFSAEQSGNMPSVQFLAYFGDGLANCASNLPAEVVATSGNCSNNYYHYSQAISELTTFATQTLYPRKIPFHVILVGKHVGPHHLALKQGSGCMTDTEARNSETDFVRGETYADTASAMAAFWGADTDHPFYQANYDLYRIARITGGVWAPLEIPTVDESLCHPGCTATSPTTAARVRYSCGSTQNQVTEYISEILGSQPFMIVPKD